MIGKFFHLQVIIRLSSWAWFLKKVISAFGEYDDSEYPDYEQELLEDEDYEQIDKEIEMDLLHDIEQIVENNQVEDAADAVVDQGPSSILLSFLWAF